MTTTSDLSIDEAGQVFVDPTAYADEARFHAATTRLNNRAVFEIPDILEAILNGAA